ncbi:unnamed protein product [marine sediment metagenome]|uniref:Phospholipase D-like domain-containing protein n=1 Tax=marine sediment metagenome TaxID=412755 RepID=X0T6R7_9ZZZZ
MAKISSTINNPLFNLDKGIVFDAQKLEIPYSHKGRVPDKRELKKALRCKTAAEAIGQLYSGCAIFGITKGQFSLVELISAISDQTGPVTAFISTWTASGNDMQDFFGYLESGKIKSVRFLVDFTFQRRHPGAAARMRELFGIESVRVTKNHAKFCLFRNDIWNIVLTSSMNMNFNPRLEHFDIQDDVGMADYLQTLMDEIFVRLKPKNMFLGIMDNTRRFGGI